MAAAPVFGVAIAIALFSFSSGRGRSNIGVFANPRDLLKRHRRIKFELDNPMF